MSKNKQLSNMTTIYRQLARPGGNVWFIERSLPDGRGGEEGLAVGLLIIITTRPKPAYGRQGLDWIVGPDYSFVVFSTNKTMETSQKP